MTSLSFVCFSVLTFFSTVPYLPGLVEDFVFDDLPAIKLNPDLKESAPWEIFLHDYWGQNITSKTSHKEYLLCVLYLLLCLI